MRQDDKNWTREELILAFNLYNRTPFGRIHMRNPELIQLARLVGRTVGAVSWKLANFARLDPTLQARGIRGAPRGSKGEAEIWREFSQNPEGLAFESERLRAERLGKRVEDVAEIETKDLPREGLDREAVVRVRVNQSFFRRRIISAYEFKCCVTGIGIRDLLVASHIVAWSKDPANRLNPQNGLCLNALHDRAFDRGLMWVDEQFTIRFSKKLRTESAELQWVLSFDGKPLRLPKKFGPELRFLQAHAMTCQKD